MKSTTKISRILIHHRWLTVILCRWILIDRQYQPYSQVGESLSTIDIDRDQSTGSINQWIGIDIQMDVGTISHHTWDHDSSVDVYPGPFLITSGTIWDHKSWSFFPWLLGKTRPGQKPWPNVWSVTRGSSSEQWAPKRPGDAHLAVSIQNHCRRLLSHFFQVQVLFQVSALFRRTLSERLGAMFQVESAPLFKHICMYRYIYIHT